MLRFKNQHATYTAALLVDRTNALRENDVHSYESSRLGWECIRSTRVFHPPLRLRQPRACL